MDLQAIIDAIKDYGAATISTISVGGISAVAVVIAKIKNSIDSTKKSMEEVLEKKDDESDKMAARYNELVRTVETQNAKIDTLTSEINKIKK